MWLETPGTLQLLVATLIIGTSCGVVAFAYDTILEAFLDFTWKFLPEKVVHPLWKHVVSDGEMPSDSSWALGMYILLICSFYGFLVGASQRLLGCPGDLPETVGSFHKQGCVLYTQVLPLPRATLPPLPASATTSIPTFFSMLCRCH